eukprot:evm.model.scf_933.4 EVM.evm.TU.scf_933.4   scf_933:7820-8886(+)
MKIIQLCQKRLMYMQFTRFETNLLKHNFKVSKGKNQGTSAGGRRPPGKKGVPPNLILPPSGTGGPPQAQAPKRGPFGVVGKSAPMESSRGRPSSQRARRVKMHVRGEEERPSKDRLTMLGTLMTRIPKDIKVKVIEDKMREQKSKFYHDWGDFEAEKRLYMAQKPIDEVRMKLLRDAGIQATAQALAPPLPRMKIIQKTGVLQEMMEAAMDMVAQRREDESKKQYEEIL